MSLPEPEEKDIYIKLASSKKIKRFTIDQIKIDLGNYQCQTSLDYERGQ